MNEQDFKDKLSPEQYRVLREKGTEAPHSGEHLHEERDGTYTCAACGHEVFSSEAKYESTTPGLIGWPSFNQAMNEGSIKTQEDNSLGMKRTEVVCANCGSHLGHVFPEDASISGTGQHYCINSLALDFNSEENSKND